MDLKQLEYFVRVAELGSFTRASAALNIAQPALSRQVRLLEVELRQNLLVRNGRGASATEAGKLMLDHARGILHQVARASEDLGRLRGSLAGRVAVGIPTSVAKVLTVPLTRAFRERMPQAQLSISEGLSVAMQESLVNGRLDVALLYNTSSGADIEVTALLQEDLHLVLRKDCALPFKPASHILSLPELSQIPLLIPTRPNAIRNLVDTELAALGLRPLVTLEIDGVAAILDLILDGAGCAVLPRNAVKTSSQSDKYTTMPIAGLRSKLGLAVSAQRPATLTQRAMQALIMEMVRQHFSE